MGETTRQPTTSYYRIIITARMMFSMRKTKGKDDTDGFYILNFTDKLLGNVALNKLASGILFSYRDVDVPLHFAPMTPTGTKRVLEMDETQVVEMASKFVALQGADYAI